MKTELGRWLEMQFIKWQMEQGERKTVRGFAAYLEVSLGTLNKWMHGDRAPDLESVQKIATKLGPEIYDLAGFPRPNSDIERIRQAFEVLSKEEQAAFADKIKQAVAAHPLYDKLSPEDREELIELARLLKQRRDKDRDQPDKPVT